MARIFPFQSWLLCTTESPGVSVAFRRCSGQSCLMGGLWGKQKCLTTKPLSTHLREKTVPGGTEVRGFRSLYRIQIGEQNTIPPRDHMALSQELDYVTEAKCVSRSRYPVTVEMRSLHTSQPRWAVARLCSCRHFTDGKG